MFINKYAEKRSSLEEMAISIGKITKYIHVGVFGAIA